MKACKQKVGRNMTTASRLLAFSVWRSQIASSPTARGEAGQAPSPSTGRTQELQTAGNWASGKVAMSYISGSLTYKRKLANVLAPHDDLSPRAAPSGSKIPEKPLPEKAQLRLRGENSY